MRIIRFDKEGRLGPISATLLGCLAMTGCGAPPRLFAVRDGQPALTATTVAWPEGRRSDLQLPSLPSGGSAPVRHFRVEFEENGQSDAYHMLCGVESPGDVNAKFWLTPENVALGQTPDPGLRGPGLRHTIGWTFITFTWPLMWVRNIDAGSIGTTAIQRWQANELSFYLVRNGKPTPTSPPADPPVADADSKLWLRARYTTGEEFKLGMPAGKEIVRVRFFKQQGPSNFWQPYESAPSVWEQASFDVSENAGAIVVTASDSAHNADCAFLAEVLERARAAQIYRLPEALTP